MYISDVTATVFSRYARQTNGLLIALEHRYFGASQPKEDLSDLRFLTVDQALSDAVDFITSYKTSRNAPTAPVYTIGTSYGGNLAAWARTKYPNVFAGALASSAPVQATYDFSGYAVSVKETIDLMTGSTTCTTNILAGYNALESALNAGKTDYNVLISLQQQYNLCTEPQTGDFGTLLANQMEIWETAIQYNTPDKITRYCNIMNGDGSPLEKLGKVAIAENQADARSCSNIMYDALISFYQSTTIDPNAYVGYRQYFYLQCTQLGYFLTSDAPTSQQCFGQGVSISLFQKQCYDTFLLTATPEAAIGRLNAAFGGTKPNTVGATNIIYTNGNMDPWSVISVTSPLGPSLTAYLISNQGHSADIYPAFGGSLQTVQDNVQSLLNQYVQSFQPARTTSSTTSSTTSRTTSSTFSTTSSASPAVVPATSSTSSPAPTVANTPATPTSSTTGAAATPTSANTPVTPTSSNAAATPTTAANTPVTPTSSSNAAATPSATNSPVTPTGSVTSSTPRASTVSTTVQENGDTFSPVPNTVNRQQQSPASRLPSSIIMAAITTIIVCIVV